MTKSPRARRTFRFWSLAVWAGLCGVPTAGYAQLPQTRLQTIFPAGGQVGTPVEVTLTQGVDLVEVAQLIFSDPRITAAPKMQPGTNPPVPVANVFTVTVPADVPPGLYPVRCLGLYGLSNSRLFEVQPHPELTEVEPNNAAAQATASELNRVVNGKLGQGTDVDYFRFTGAAGQSVTITCRAASIDSPIDPVVELFEPGGRRIARTERQDHDGTLSAVLPAAGEYLVRVRDLVYAGGETHVYRLHLTIGPSVVAVWPPVAVPGSTATYQVFGHNLAGGSPSPLRHDGRPVQVASVPIAVTAPQPTPSLPWSTPSQSLFADAFAYVWKDAAGTAAPVPIGFSATPPQFEAESADPNAPQAVTAPGDVVGRFDSAQDTDTFEFEATAGESWWLAVQADTLGSLADVRLFVDQVVVDPQGKTTLKRIGGADDDTFNPLPTLFETLHRDPSLKLDVPQTGKYRVSLRDRTGYQHAGDVARFYHLSIRRPAPDFQVAAVPAAPAAPTARQAQPWGLTLRKGDQASCDVLVRRTDGWAGTVTVSVAGLPAGVECPAVEVPASQSVATLVFRAAEDAATAPAPLQVQAQGRVTPPPLQQAVDAAAAQVAAVQKEVEAANAAVAPLAAALQQKQAALVAAQQQLAAKPDDAALQAQVKAAETQVAEANVPHQAAVEKQSAAAQKLAATQAQLAAARTALEAGTLTVTHPVRFGTVARTGEPATAPPRGRLDGPLVLNVVGEAAPFQAKSEPLVVDACHNRQLFLPVALVRRAGFEAPVTLTWSRVPANLQAETKPLPKETAADALRLFVPANVAAGVYTLDLTASGTVAYRRQPERLTKAQEVLKAADAALIAANAEKTQLQTALTQLDQQIAAQTVAVNGATEQKAAAEKQVPDAQKALETAKAQVTAAAENAEQKAAAEAVVKEKETALTAAQGALATATEKLTAASAEKARLDAAKAAEAAKVAPADEKIKQQTAAKAEAEKQVKAAEEATKPQNLNVFQPTFPVTIRVKPAPVVLTAAVAGEGKMKTGEKREVKVDVKRQNGFAGPVTLTLAGRPDLQGLTAAPVVVPPEAATGTLVIEATGDLPAGPVPALVVRSQSAFDGDAIVDQPITVTIEKP